MNQRTRSPIIQRWLTVVVTCIALALGCVADGDPPPAQRAAPSSTSVPAEETGSVLLSPPQPKPGERVAVRFQNEPARGGYLVLEQWAGEAWLRAVGLLTEHNDQTANVFDLDTAAGYPDDYGVGGSGPDVVQLPPELEPGEWRICSDGPGPIHCGLFVVAA